MPKIQFITQMKFSFPQITLCSTHAYSQNPSVLIATKIHIWNPVLNLSNASCFMGSDGDWSLWWAAGSGFWHCKCLSVWFRDRSEWASYASLQRKSRCCTQSSSVGWAAGKNIALCFYIWMWLGLEKNWKL